MQYIEGKYSLILNNSLIESVVKKLVYKKRYSLEVYQTSADSVLIKYANGFISNIKKYKKNWNISSFNNNNDYKLSEELDYEITDNNITKVIRKKQLLTIISKYTYDDEPYVNMGEFKAENPYTLYHNILTYDKLGNKNANNIIKVENEFIGVPFGKYFKYINFERNLDEFGRIKKILMTGESISENPNNTTEMSFTNEEYTFTYQ